MHASSPKQIARLTVLPCILLLLGAEAVQAQLEFEGPPINYNSAPVSDHIAQLQQQIDSGQTKLEFDETHGYLPALLKLLDVDPASQMLVFSQTSFQLRRITPHRPRSIYFNDHTYVGWVQGGDVVELSTVDPQQGAIFYTLEQTNSDKPHFVRDRGQCLTCHASSRTQGVPGHLVRSVFPDEAGRPLLGSGTFTTDHRSPFSERWGGWFVSGQHGSMRHMGNAFARDRNRPEEMDRERGANLVDLSPIVDVSPYLSPHSDLVALMVLEHQSQMHNLITFANFEARSALHYDQVMNEALERPAEYQSETTTRRLAKAADRLVKYMLFVDEFSLASPVEGVSDYAERFSRRGPRDRQGRSLRELDLQHRMFKYPCSYLIYSDAFDQLPPPVLQLVYTGLRDALDLENKDPAFAHLSAADRVAIREILSDTKPRMAEVFAASAP